MTEHAERLLSASPREIRAILLDPLRLPDWNPAFTTITETDHGYRITARGLPGEFSYTAVEPLTIGWTWRVPGFVEVGTWTMTVTEASTSVRHEFVHSGPLASVLRHAYRGVADLRLDRLATRLGELGRGATVT